MADLPYSFEPTPGYEAYKVSSLLRDYLGMLMEQSENKETIQQILTLINGLTAQLKDLRIKNRLQATREVYKGIDKYFDTAPEDNKRGIQCKEGCTACCYIEIDVTEDEASVIIEYCKEHGIVINRDYLIKQASVGRKTYSVLSRCVFLKDNRCGIYPVRPIACRKHWVKTDPLLCDFSNNIANPVGVYFDVNTEILASSVLNVAESGPLEKMLLNALDTTLKV